MEKNLSFTFSRARRQGCMSKSQYKASRMLLIWTDWARGLARKRDFMGIDAFCSVVGLKGNSQTSQVTRIYLLWSYFRRLSSTTWNRERLWSRLIITRIIELTSNDCRAMRVNKAHSKEQDCWPIHATKEWWNPSIFWAFEQRKTKLDIFIRLKWLRQCQMSF